MMTRRVKIDDVALNVAEQGAGPPILLVHGFPLDHTMWRGQLAGLSDEFRLIAPDLRGFGGSDVLGETVSMEQFADDLARLLDALAIDEPVAFCGLSMGGYIAWQFARRHASRLGRLIVCDTRAVPDTPEAAAGRRTLAQRVLVEGSRVAADAMLPRLFAEQTHIEQPDVVEQTRATILATRPAGIAAAARGMAERGDVRPWLKEIAVPTLALVGEHDVISTADEMRGIAASIPGARLEVIAQAGHMAPLEQPSAVNAAIRQFMHGSGGED